MHNWNEMVIYELHIGTFNVKGEGQIGDFYSAIERLDYLKALGINAVELMPIAEFPGGYSWGYNPAPVSYTHLDVYKRQVYGQQFAVCCFW